LLAALAETFSPRYERHADALVTIDVSGLTRLFGDARAIGEALQKRSDKCWQGQLNIAIAGTWTAALVLALEHPGLTVVERGHEAERLSRLPIGVLAQALAVVRGVAAETEFPELAAIKHWGLRTLGELAALPPADLVARLGPQALAWQAIARGQDPRPLIPALADERFESSLELEWPIEAIEPLSFVLTRLLEPLSTRLERRDRGAAVLHVQLRLVTRDTYTRRLELPSPIRDVRTLRTLALLDLESHPAPAPIDAVTILIEPTPGRVLQHTLFTRAQPTPEQLSTLLARLNAVMGQDRVGAAVILDTYRPGAFDMRSFPTEPPATSHQPPASSHQPPASSHQPPATSHQPPASSHLPPLVSALRRCRPPVPARVVVADDRPVRVTTDRRGFAGGPVLQAAGPWRTSGAWWATQAGRERQRPERGASRKPGEAGPPSESERGGPVSSEKSWAGREDRPYWNRDEWDVAVGDDAIYRIFRDRDTGGWFIDAIVD
jgi:protein ImuB